MSLRALHRTNYSPYDMYREGYLCICGPINSIIQYDTSFINIHQAARLQTCLRIGHILTYNQKYTLPPPTSHSGKKCQVPSAMETIAMFCLNLKLSVFTSECSVSDSYAKRTHYTINNISPWITRLSTGHPSSRSR